MTIVIIGIAALFLLAGVPTSLLAQEQSRQPIIDMHLHADLPPEEISAGAAALCRPEPCRGEGSATSGGAETFERTLQAMKRYTIVKAS